MNVAEQHPARMDANGTWWMRARRDPGVGIDQSGWTPDPRQVHQDCRTTTDTLTGG